MTAGPLLYVKMLRYRAALMIWLFLLLGAAREGGHDVGPSHLWAAAALASSYVSATTLNDIADKDIDRVNHRGDHGRPLVTGEAGERDLYRLNAVAALLAVVCAVVIGTSAVLVVVVGLVVGYVYSAPPLQISHRTYAAPLVLAVGYAAVPYSLGSVVVGGSFGGPDVAFLGALMALFVARIVLKDFRDRRGDAMYGRPTLLLRFGKDATCAVSLGALLIGDVLLVHALRPPVGFIVLIQMFFAAIVYMLHRLRAAPNEREEQVAIGIGARMGNGLLLCVLGWLLLAAQGAPHVHGVAFASAVAAAYAWAFVVLCSRPHEVLVGYKG